MKTILWALVVIIVGLYITAPVLDPDLWWHIAIGRWILTQGDVPTVEHWNIFGLGRPFKAYSWSFEILAAYVYDTFGMKGLFYAKVLLGQLISFASCYVMSRISRDWFFGLLLGIFCVLACHAHFTFRPQSFTWIYLLFLILFVDNAVERERLFPEAIWIAVMLCLWANLHITTALALGAIGLWGAKSREHIGLAAWLVFFGALGTVLTPYFGAEWIIFLHKTDHPLAFSSITEFKPASILQYNTGFVLVAVFLAALFFHMRPRLFVVARVLLAGIFLLGGLAVIKFLPYAGIVVLALIATVWRSANEKKEPLGNIQEAIGKLAALFNRIPAEGLGFILLCVVCTLGYQLKAPYVLQGLVPIEPIAFIEEKKLKTPWLHTFGYGGYVMKHFTDKQSLPTDHVVIDGRTNVTPLDVFTVFDTAGRGKRGWRELLDITEPETILWRGESPFVTLLLQSGEWCLVFEEKESQLNHAVLIKQTTYDSRKADFPDAICQS